MKNTNKNRRNVALFKNIFHKLIFSSVIIYIGQNKTFNIVSQTRNFTIWWDYKAHAYDLI